MTKILKLLYILYNESKHNILALVGKAIKLCSLMVGLSYFDYSQQGHVVNSILSRMGCRVVEAWILLQFLLEQIMFSHHLSNVIITSIKWLGWLRQGFLFQSCAVGGLAVIHKQNEPNLAKVSDRKVNFFLEFCFVWQLSRNKVSNYDDLRQFFLKIWQLWLIFSQRILCILHIEFYFIFALVRNTPPPPSPPRPAPKKKTLVETLGTKIYIVSMTLNTETWCICYEVTVFKSSTWVSTLDFGPVHLHTTQWYPQ
jgi:hypothetical protein